jgi:hypothetical protein
MEQAKTQGYTQAMTHLGLPASALVPFVVEASGRAGHAAQAFLRNLDTQTNNTAEHHNQRSNEHKTSTRLLTSVSHVVWRGNCRLLQAMATLAPRIAYQHTQQTQRNQGIQPDASTQEQPDAADSSANAVDERSP